MSTMTPQPMSVLAWLLRQMSSRDAASAAVGDLLDELAERTRVAQQSREIGLRVALGAMPRLIRHGVLRLAGTHLLAGLAIGLPAAWWMSRGFAAYLFQVTPADPSVYAGVATVVCTVGFAAALVPARRAARTDPMITLRG